MTMAIRVAGNEEGKGSKAIAMATTRVAGEQQQRGQRGQWQRQQGWQTSKGNGNKEGNSNEGWWASKRAMAMVARAMAMAKRVVCVCVTETSARDGCLQY
jgi:hypothetical protein